jgi:hypothetical protein
VAYHSFKDFDTTVAINDRIPTTYGGPLSLSMDYMVWNINKDEIAGGKLDVEDVIQPTYDEIHKKYGLKEKQD